MNRTIKLLLSTAIISTMLVHSGTSKAADSDKRINVVMIVADDHGKDALGCYGNPVIQTPALDQLAKEGIRFNNAYCTSASCTASRSVILSGVHNHANGLYGHIHAFHHFRAFDKLVTLPVRLSRAGYKTARIGKYHLAPEEVFQFDTTLKTPGRNTVKMSDNCRSFINETKEPFFLYYCTIDPHRGGGVREEIAEKPDAFGNLAEGYPDIEPKTYTHEEVLVPNHLPDSPEARAEIAQYYESCTRVDRGVERLIKILKESGKYENTLIMYISDNGMAFPGAKTTIYEPGIQLPCIIKLPGGKKANTENDGFISWVDLTPTILDMTGTEYKQNEIQGRSFKELLYSGDATGWDEIYASHTFHEITMYYPMRVVRKGDFKLIFNIAHGLEYPNAQDLWSSATWQGQLKTKNPYYGKRKIQDYLHRARFELYNLKNDPDEVVNLIDHPEHQELAAELKEKLQKFQKETKDPWEVKWRYE